MRRPPIDWALDSGTLQEWAGGGPPEARDLWARIDALRAGGAIRFWISAATLAALAADRAPAAEQARRKLAGEAGRGWRPITADAMSAGEAVSGDWADWSLPMAHAGFRRICPEGRFVTRDGQALGRLDGAAAPEQALREAEGGAPAPVPVPMLDLREEYRLNQAAMDRALLGGAAAAHYVLGREVAAFETSLAGYLGTSHALGVSSGTEALVLALHALARRRLGRERFAADDLVLTTPFTFVATGSAILRAGATPLFVDVDPRTGNLDAEAVRRCLKNPPGRIVGLIPVHLFGRPCDMDAFRSLAGEHGLFLLEDVAQALGATWRGARVGSLGDISAFSFYPSKNLGGFGDAGAVATSDPALAESVSMLLKHGVNPATGTFDALGYNARLDTLQAAVLLAKLPGVDRANADRRRVARAYLDGLANLPGLSLPEWPGEDPGSHVFHQFTLRAARRDGLRASLTGKGIATMIYYPYPLHKMPVFAGRCHIAEASPGAGLPEAEAAAREVLSLPIGPSQGEASIEAVIAAVRAGLGIQSHG